MVWFYPACIEIYRNYPCFGLLTCCLRKLVWLVGMVINSCSLLTHTIHCSDFLFCVLKYRKNGIIWSLIWDLHQPLQLVIVVINCYFGVIFSSFWGVLYIWSLLWWHPTCSTSFVGVLQVLLLLLITCNTHVISLPENWYDWFLRSLCKKYL